MHILVTGGLGYLGSAIAKHLGKEDHKIFIASRSHQPIEQSFICAEYRKVNWDSQDSLDEACQDIDMIIHAAGMTAHECFKNPILAKKFNGYATNSLVNSAISKNVKYFIYLSTAHVYQSPLTGLITEETPLLNNHPYAISNVMGEEAVLSKSKTEDIKGLVLRLSNIFGPPVIQNIDYRSLLIGDISYQAVINNEIRLSSNGKQFRNFMSITELCNVFSFLIKEIDNLSSTHTLNVGSTWNTSILNAATLVSKVISNRMNKEIKVYTNKDYDKAEDILDFSSKKLYDLGYLPLDNVNDELNNLASFCLALRAKKKNE